MCKSETSRILFFIYIFFQKSKACAGFILESQLKSKISHSLIHMGFTGIVTWSGVRGPWKKGLERLKECLGVILSKNLENLACTFGDLCLFFSSLAFGGFYFLFLLIVAQLHACVHCSSRWFSGGSYSGFLFCFCCFFFVFIKQICFGSEGVAKDKLVFGMLKHDHVSF